jgi:hypothetical protein
MEPSSADPRWAAPTATSVLRALEGGRGKQPLAETATQLQTDTGARDDPRTRDLALGRKDATARAVRVFRKALDASTTACNVYARAQRSGNKRCALARTRLTLPDNRSTGTRRLDCPCWTGGLPRSLDGVVSALSGRRSDGTLPQITHQPADPLSGRAVATTDVKQKGGAEARWHKGVRNSATVAIVSR